MRNFQPYLLPDESTGEPWSVSDLTAHIKSLIDDEPDLQDVRVRGELSNVSRPASGHVYFTLKDGGSQIKCAMWRSSAARLGNYRPRDGDAVTARGRVSVYERDGAYQLYVEALAAAGTGDLYAEFERLKLRLQAEGLFDADRKRALPQFPRALGVVTSATAAAFQDILNVLRRRYPLVQVILAPTLVQGSEAPAQIVRAIQQLNQLAEPPDVILVARGGGSMEELRAFNDERVARAVAGSRVPTVSGVGHEVDFTLTDFAADVRAPTPSAAAEIITPDVNELQQWVDGAATRISHLMSARLADARAQYESLHRALRALSPIQQVTNYNLRVNELRGRLARALHARVLVQASRVNTLQGALEALSPLATLARGYAIVRRVDGSVVRAADDVSHNDRVRIRVRTGDFGATVDAR